MCERFFLKLYGQLAEAFGVADAPSIERYNITPGQTVPVVVQSEAGRQLRMMKWGLVPSWSRDPSIGFKTINARSETVAEKPTFRAAFKKRHCLVPASGFFEWKTIGKKKLPTLFRPREGLFAFAGLWETWEKGGEPLNTFTILTTSANEVVTSTHDRMPVILDRADYGTWLDATKGGGELLRPYRAEAMTATPVDTFVNDARHEGPQCIEPRADQPPLFGEA